MGLTVEICLCCGSKDFAANQAIWMPFVSDRAMGLPPMEITDGMQLRTIKKGMAYALCKSLYCRSCGHLFVNYRFDDEEMSRLYKDYRGKDYCSLRERYEPGYALQNAAFTHGISHRTSIEAFLRGMIPAGELNVLDWGGDTGRNTPFVDEARVVHIYEPSGIKPEVSNAVNVLEPGDFLPDYDLLILSNVLEHMPWPSQTLRTVADYMSFSSILFVEVPYESIQSTADANWASKQTPVKVHWHEHINFFSQGSLAALLETCCFQILSSAVQEIDRGETGVSSVKALRFACKRI
jgi:hypothetical protein